jgi:hypothetical protein
MTRRLAFLLSTLIVSTLCPAQSAEIAGSSGKTPSGRAPRLTVKDAEAIALKNNPAISVYTSRRRGDDKPTHHRLWTYHESRSERAFTGKSRGAKRSCDKTGYFVGCRPGFLRRATDPRRTTGSRTDGCFEAIVIRPNFRSDEEQIEIRSRLELRECKSGPGQAPVSGRLEQ